MFRKGTNHILHLLLTLPDGRLAGVGSRRVLIGAYGIAAVLALAVQGAFELGERRIGWMARAARKA